MQRQLSVAHRPDAAQALVGFRRDLHNSVFGWADATFELCDALLCAPGRVASIPALSLEPVFRRERLGAPMEYVGASSLGDLAVELERVLPHGITADDLCTGRSRLP